MVSFRLSEEVIAKVDAIAESERRTRSNVLLGWVLAKCGMSVNSGTSISGLGESVEVENESLAPRRRKSTRKPAGSASSTTEEVAASKSSGEAVPPAQQDKSAPSVAKYPADKSVECHSPDSSHSVPVEQVREVFSNRDRHVPKECRTYGCGLCRLAGYKDLHRGLK
jgi:hypothetical protein